jgi:hypothetical protein
MPDPQATRPHIMTSRTRENIRESLLDLRAAGFGSKLLG